MRERRYLRGRGSIGAWVLWLVVLLLLAVVVSPLYRPISFSTPVKQQAQLHSLDASIELVAAEQGEYPPSAALDPTGKPYCGAMKLMEAIMGQDFLGFHPTSGFRADGLDPSNGAALYPRSPSRANLEARVGPYLQPENANAWRLSEIYGEGNTGPFPEDAFVLCDVYGKRQPNGDWISMPILYYRADPNGTLHDANDPDNPANIYHWRDNLALLELGVPGDPNVVHPLADPNRFYLNTQSDKIAGRPVRADSYILISAGEDGLYGTADDMCNFEWKYRQH